MSVLRTVTTTVLGLALMGLVFSPGAKASEWNRKTVITFSGPVEIPGVHLTGWKVLPAGTYVFKLMDSESDRHIVQIFNKDETKCYATILAIPNYRLKATGKTVITFRERPAGQPEDRRRTGGFATEGSARHGDSAHGRGSATGRGGHPAARDRAPAGYDAGTNSGGAPANS